MSCWGYNLIYKNNDFSGKSLYLSAFIRDSFDCKIEFDTESIVLAFIVNTFAAERITTIAMATTIGQMIEEEVRRQGWNITEFAEKICCTRPNVYNIFERNRMDVAQLQIISKVLDHNFFMDLAENPELADASNPEVKKDLLNRRAVAQFFDVMPTVFKNLNMEISIVMPIMKNEFEDPLPDYGLSDVAIFFTVGERLLDRFDKERLACWDIQTCVAYKNHVVDIWHNTINHMWFADVKLDYKTEEEWGEIIVYLLDSWGIPLKIRNYDNGKA